MSNHTTHWQENELKSLEEVIKTFSLESISDNYKNPHIIWEFTEPKDLSFGDIKVKYNILVFTAEVSNYMGDMITINHDIVVCQQYGEEMPVNYIIDKNASGAKTLLRQLLGYTGRMEIEQKPLNLNADILLWMIKKVFTTENVFEFKRRIESEEVDTLKIDGIFGLSGETSDENKLKAEGNSVLKLASTLTFILDSERVRNLAVQLEYIDHDNIELSLRDAGVMSVNIESYSGSYEDLNYKEKRANILLLCYLDVIPKLRISYSLDKTDGEWNNTKINEFYNLIKNELIQKLSDKQKSISQEKQKDALSIVSAAE
ncbi:hypothetical protein ABQD63_04255 [Lactococcus garvieae]|uniref:hypothetical protein n=1 Tax=Lactococcus TaxID=1357 RepID=UPI0032E3D9AC